MKTITSLDSFTRSYLGAILWSTHDESTPQGGDPMDQKYTLEDFAPAAVEAAAADCERFQRENAADLELANISDSGETPSRAGFLFALNRNGHGTGFWDEKTHRDPQAEQDACDRLADAARAFGEACAYVGDDGQIYF